MQNNSDNTSSMSCLTLDCDLIVLVEERLLQIRVVQHAVPLLDEVPGLAYADDGKDDQAKGGDLRDVAK